MIGPVFEQQLDPMLETGEKRGCMLGGDDLDGMRIECHHDNGPLAAPVAEQLENVLVSEVDTIEDANGQRHAVGGLEFPFGMGPAKNRHGSTTSGVMRAPSAL